MSQPSNAHPILLRSIVILYFLLFFSALLCSGYLLSKVLHDHPILLIGLLKYILLCILFLVLLVNTAKAFTLKSEALTRLTRSTANFKWLFLIALMITVAARLGLFSITGHRPIEANFLQIGLLTAIAIFCFWSDHILSKEAVPPES